MRLSARDAIVAGALALGAALLALGWSPREPVDSLTTGAGSTDSGSQGSEVALPSRDLKPTREARASGSTQAPAEAARTDSELALTARIFGRVLTVENLPPPFASVVCESTSTSTRRAVDIAGDGSFEIHVEPGRRYRLLIDEDSLPEGYLPPVKQRTVSNAPLPGYYATEVSIPDEGGAVEADLRVFRSASVVGRVVGPEGRGVPNCWVRVRREEAAFRGVSRTAHTDDAGWFELEGVTPGTSILQVMPQSSTDATYRSMSVPPPLRVMVKEAGRYDLPTVRIGAGRNSIEGRLVDESGRAWEGLQVRVFEGPDWGGTLATARTDPSGRFRLEGLHGSKVSVLLTEDYSTGTRALGARRIRWPMPAVELDMTAPAGPDHDLGDVVIPASRPFFFEGTVDPRDERALRDVEVEVSWLSEPAAADPPAAPWARTLEQPEFDPTEGVIRWSCETPHPPVRVTVTHPDAPEDQHVELVPRPDDTQRETLRLRLSDD